MPTSPDGNVDKDTVKAMFMASKFLNWTEFAEAQGWDALFTRRQLPVKIWIKEKRDRMAELQFDILSGMVHEHKFKWIKEILATMDNYGPAIDLGMNIAKAKLSQITDMFKDYQDNFRGKPEAMFYKGKRRYHPFEKMSGTEVGSILAGMKAITEAKLKSLMMDKWAVSKLDLPLDGAGDEEGVGVGPRFTIEGKDIVDATDLQRWFDTYHDKPSQAPASVNSSSNEGTKIEPDADGGS
jgi:hypothetical protein